MISFFKNNPQIREAADKLFRTPHDNYEARIEITQHLLRQLKPNTQEKAYFEALLEKIQYEQDDANQTPDKNLSL